MKDVVIGVLALQGDYEAHQKVLEGLGIRAPLVRTQEELDFVDGLILPGGESTTIGKMLDRHGLFEPIRERAEGGMPTFGTCAGMILMARDIRDSVQLRLGLMDIEVSRNAFGRQIESFEADIPVAAAGSNPVRGVFIRAPFVSRKGPDVENLGEFEGKIVVVREGNLLASAFHPELTDDSRLHALFVDIVRRSNQQSHD
jgi:5'-phosphate synthase pdxT subunit